MEKNRDITAVLEALNSHIVRLESDITTEKWFRETAEKERGALKEKCETLENENSVLKAASDKDNGYIKHLEAKIYDLEERLAIATESNAPCPMWEIEPPKPEANVSEVTTVTNVSKVIIEEDVE